MIALVVLLLGVAGLALTAALLAREPDTRIRVAAVAGAGAGFLLALFIALLAGKSLLVAVATATLGAAVLALVFIGQWLLIRWIGTRQQATGNRK
jgi:hypothetical protein